MYKAMNENHYVTAYQVETPFYDPEYEEFDDYYGHELTVARNKVAQRMIFILIIVPLLAISLAFIAWPMSGNVTAFENDAVDLSTKNMVDTSNENLDPQLGTMAPSIGQGAIAPFFTPEVMYWESKIVEWANLHGVDPNAVATIMQIESCGDPQAVSIAGARGLFQVMPFHFSSGEDMMDPDTNATRGLNFLNEQLRYTGGDIFLSFAGYNGGYAASGGAYENWANETQRYYQWARGIYEDAQAGLSTSETLDAWLAAGGAAGCQRAAGRLNLN